MANDPNVIVNLLLALASGTEAQKNKHDVIFLAAVNIIREYQNMMVRCHLSNRDEA